MGFYSRYILPKLIHRACGTKPAMMQRRKLVPRARGAILEIGIGSGLNLPFYDANAVTKVFGLDPSPEIARIARKAARESNFEVEFIILPGEEIPLEDDSVDTILMTYTLCSIPDTELALKQMAWVLKPEGRLLFCEHGAAPDPKVRKWQDRLTPAFHMIGGGCHLNRAIPDLIERGGFRLEEIKSRYLPGWRPGSFNYWGSAMQNV